MSEIELYVHPTCTSCRKAQAWLDEHDVPYARRDYFRDRFTRDELAAVLASANLTPRDVLSKRAKAYKALVGDRELTDDQLLDLMIQEPTLLRRPLLISAGNAVIGFDRAGLENVAGSTRPVAGR
ncbi:MAG: Spx/MgsR family RNA polymerase-binding regulatory protein [Thermomicrobiales bacterium]|nr:Spx/MgsR family RNA polymerase-binding regulatory protein [Thermomicrobiales bacterium]MCO5220506.1 Spx/MgsR family RNA polymerase-binding regulatory protein [Thermomicrobiales bacterium]